MVLLAVFHRDTSSLQLLRETFGDAVVEKAIFGTVTVFS